MTSLFILILLYLQLSIFAGTLIVLKKYKDDASEQDNVNVSVILIAIQVLLFIIPIGSLIFSDFKASVWYGPIISISALLGLALFTVISILIVTFYKKGYLKKFIKKHGEHFAIYSMISAICLFLIFILVVGIAYSLGAEFKTEGLANLIGLAGIITTLLGILVTLFQMLKN